MEKDDEDMSSKAACSSVGELGNFLKLVETDRELAKKTFSPLNVRILARSPLETSQNEDTSSKAACSSVVGELGNFLKLVETDRDLANKTFSPLNVRILARSPLETIQKVYEIQPPNLSWDPVVQACKYGSSKEVIRFLVGKHKRWPGSAHDEFLEASKGTQDPEVLSILIDKLKEAKLDAFLFGENYLADLDFVSRVALMLPLVKHLRIIQRQWTEEALLHFLCSVYSSQNIQSITVRIPKVTAIAPGRANSSIDLFWMVQSLRSLGSSRCCVEKIEIFELPQTSHIMRAVGVGLIHCPRLQELFIDYEDITPKGPSLSMLGQVLKHCKLKSLRLRYTQLSTQQTPRDESGTLRVENCSTILELLRYNHHLESLDVRFKGAWCNFSTAESTFVVKLESILQHDNTKLSKAIILVVDTDTRRDSDDDSDADRQTANATSQGFESDRYREGELPDKYATNACYYLALNGAGRGLVRHFDQTGLTMAGFVDLLADLAETVRYHKRHSGWGGRGLENATRIQHGLLREMPGFWSEKGPGRISRGTKRKQKS